MYRPRVRFSTRAETSLNPHGRNGPARELGPGRLRGPHTRVHPINGRADNYLPADPAAQLDAGTPSLAYFLLAGGPIHDRSTHGTMSQETTPAPSAPAASQKKALLEAFDTVLKSQAEMREAERAAEAARRRGRGVSRLLMVVCTTILVFIAAYLYVERPDWVFPTPPAPESLAVREASLRIVIANAAQHVERFHQQTGHWPTTLEQAGARGTGVRYERTGTGYQLQGENGGARVRFDSAEPLARFIGNSFEVISRRSR